MLCITTQLVAVQEQSLVDIAMPGQYMNGEEPSQEGIVFLEGISANVHVSDLMFTLEFTRDDVSAQ